MCVTVYDHPDTYEEISGRGANASEDIKGPAREKHSIHGFEKKVRHSIDLYTNMEGRKDDDEELVDSRKTRSHSRMKRFVMEFWLATNEERGNER
ncbi:hypothetical protein HZU73_02166 [Apis mellifera caucasica]|nr:hypothetical protein HZU73_02166 [Apis mellifera caucasica]KAG9437945.1 hypothetical protein HZU67_00955 [Apis mellifera carnica]